VLTRDVRRAESEARTGSNKRRWPSAGLLPKGPIQHAVTSPSSAYLTHPCRTCGLTTSRLEGRCSGDCYVVVLSNTGLSLRRPARHNSREPGRRKNIGAQWHDRLERQRRKPLAAKRVDSSPILPFRPKLTRNAPATAQQHRNEASASRSKPPTRPSDWPVGLCTMTSSSLRRNKRLPPTSHRRPFTSPPARALGDPSNPHLSSHTSSKPTSILLSLQTTHMPSRSTARPRCGLGHPNLLPCAMGSCARGRGPRA
jgi:hypothetical protein